ncbi:LacI family DNA-binding transcriptional regulator [Dyadobacter sp. NIV53]|uniref:LacI family DNA-binding transcriptional regulator n=1 Tax=Dyadobacter sp. NIV53 TaxID=2861765 RepID=UPI001C869BBE|nr:substrate-binding domain-containing protein [Dyadobacter sp. NIV53]
MQKKASLKSIADKVGVSTTLVSYVLNNKMENRISKEVAQNIRDTAKELNYNSNQIARSLKTNKTFTIGLIVADISNPFSSALARIIEDEADKAGYTVIYGSSDENPQKSQKLIDTFLNKQVDGLIIAPCHGSEAQIIELENRNFPFVLVDRYFPEITTNYVALNNFQASYMAVNHLIDHGHKRIGMITLNSPLHHMKERKRGYMEALLEHDRTFVPDHLIELSQDFSSADIEGAFYQLLGLKEPIDAIYLTTNQLGMFGLKYINSNKIKVPEELAVISFDETEFLDLFSTPVTQLRQPLKEMGTAATEILIAAIADNNKLTQLNMQPLLVIRGSSTMTGLPKKVLETEMPPAVVINPLQLNGQKVKVA